MIITIRVVELMVVFGDAARLVWGARRFHKFLVHKFLRRYFGVDFRDYQEISSYEAPPPGRILRFGPKKWITV